MNLKITVLGSGTSSGVPTIGCSCEVCRSEDPRDNRLRPSILITVPPPEGDRNIVIDTTPDFRTQVLREKITRLDAIVYTHGHADHILGLDDVRPFNYHQGGRIPLYASEKTMAVIQRVFEYIFAKRGPKTSIPQVEVNLINDEPFEVFGLRFQPVPLTHGNDTIYGYRFGDVAYLTDHNEIPESSMPLLRGLDVLFLDALRHRPHPTHTTVAVAIERAKAIGAKRTFFTHMCHDVAHAATEAALPEGIHLAYDGLQIEVNQARMRVFRSQQEIPAEFGPSVVTIGNFDGVHVGHRAIMRRVVAIANERRLTPMVMTFDPHPAQVLAPERAPKLLMTIQQRLRSIQKEGIEAVWLCPFSLEFAKATPEEFARDILAGKLHARVVLVGEDFRFGRGQAGNIETLRTLGQQFGFEVEAVAGIGWRGPRVSSTGIRKAVAEGRVSRACRMLGAPFALEGTVVRGHGVGSKQTVPTLNLQAQNEVLPGHGVYVTRTRDLDSERNWPSITNVGVRPTFGGDELTVETFLLEPLEGPTPETIEVSFLRFVRNEAKFATPEALKAQILKDVGVAKRLHRRLAVRHVT